MFCHSPAMRPSNVFRHSKRLQLQRSGTHFRPSKCMSGSAPSRNTIPTSECTPSQPTGESIMQLASNRATRYVYLRTLPLRQQVELDGQVEDIAAQIEDSTKRMCEKHIPTLLDDRAAVHLHTAALAIATHRVLTPRIRNELRLSNIIRAGFGVVPVPNPSVSQNEKETQNLSQKARPDFWIVRAALWFSFDRMAAIRRMTSNMLRDFGSTFSSESLDDFVDGKPRHTVLVRKCYYHSICKDEGVEHLTSIFCSLDRALYSPISVKSHGIEFKLDKTLVDKDNTTKHCEFSFVKHK